MSYMIVIQTGLGQYGAKVGWDGVYATRREAQEVARQAERNSGWSARVLRVHYEPCEPSGGVPCPRNSEVTR